MAYRLTVRAGGDVMAYDKQSQRMFAIYGRQRAMRTLKYSYAEGRNYQYLTVCASAVGWGNVGVGV